MRWLAVVAVLNLAMLVLLVPRQLFDTNFYSLWEATNLLAGDHPYRDFYEWGVPLQAALSTLTQWLVGYRLAGEFLVIHWTFIIAGAVLSFDIGYRVTQSAGLSIAMSALAAAVLPDMPTFHYAKVFFYPLTVWLAWYYVDRPGPGRAAALGLLTAVAFLFRHDHGVYIGGAAVLACALTRWARPASRAWRTIATEVGAYAAPLLIVLTPWLAVVQVNEGVVDYVRARSELYQLWSASGTYQALLSVNPVPILAARWMSAAPPASGTVSFIWSSQVSEEERRKLEARFGLEERKGPDAGRWTYVARNVNDPDLYGLFTFVDSTRGIDWEPLRARNSWLPTRAGARVILAQITAVVPLLLLLSSGVGLLRAFRAGMAPSDATCKLALASAFLCVVDARLFREPSYSHLVAPLTAALGSAFLVRPRDGRLAERARVGVACVVLLAVGVAVFVIAEPRSIVGRGTPALIARAFRQMFDSRPIDVFADPADVAKAAEGFDRQAWEQGRVPISAEVMLRYMHDCTAKGDRVLVSGSTPYHIGYLLERPVAGGQVFWHYKWRASHQQQLLMLLRSQSVPFAFSTHDPVLNDLAAYPAIRDYFETRYTVLPGTRGLLLVDRARTPSGTFAPFGFPCFS